MNDVTASYRVYNNGKQLLGLAKVTMPNIAFLTQTLSAAGIGGNIEVIFSGFVDTMSMGLDFNYVTEDVLTLLAPTQHRITLNEARQVEDDVTGDISYKKVKYVVTVIPKNLNLGSRAPASPSDASGEYTVRSFTQYVDGKVIIDIDPAHNKCIINGVDYFAPLLEALN